MSFMFSVGASKADASTLLQPIFDGTTLNFLSISIRYVDVEVLTPTGRVDIVMKTDKALYLFELKLNMSAQAAMKQIDLKDYASKFALSGLPIVKVGINFNPERRTIGDWKVEDA